MKQLAEQIIFDFDGTLCDSEEGIVGCVEYALREIGEPPLPLAMMRRFIGPALYLSFLHTAGLEPERAELAVKKYRERYIPIGVYECRLYDGIEDLLQDLHRRGVPLFIASAKPQQSVLRAAAHLGIDGYFTKIIGAPPDVKRNEKDDYIRAVKDYRSAIMVGDSPYDIEAGRRTGCETVAVTYGFFSTSELRDCKPDHIADSVGALRELLLGKLIY